MITAETLFLQQLKTLEQASHDLQGVHFTLRSFAKIDRDIEAALIHINESLDTVKSARTRLTLAVDRRLKGDS